METDLTPRARVIADSVSPVDIRLSTLEVVIHRFVLAEMNTHRAFSRNSASSRAIPVARMMAKVATRPAVPLEWPAEQRGMQGGGQIADPGKARDIWLAARDAAVVHAEQLAGMGVHKSVVNRLLEPFLPHTVIITATDWSGFWHQRCSPLAQPEIRVAAEAMRAALDASTPRPVDYGQWHTPYISDQERDQLGEAMLRRVSAARCARVSYLTHAGIRDPDADVDLYARLLTAQPPHASPLEHVATPAYCVGRTHDTVRGNFDGWHQLRHLVLDQ